ncbi:MAG: polysaccharide biosynthesis tyrosine autokinase [Chloroflexota bacterium]
MELKQYLQLLRRWMWLLIVCALLGMIGGYIYSLQQTPIYRATTKILIMRAPEDRMPDAYAIYTELQLAKTYAQLITTEPVLEQTSALLNSNVGAGQIRVKQVEETQVLEVTVDDTDPQRAADIANTLIAVFIHYNEELQTTRYASSEETLQAQLQAVESQIQQIQSDILNASEETLQTQQQQVESQISSLQTEMLEVRGRLEALQVKDEDLLTESEKLQIEEEKARLDQLQGLLSLYQQIYLNIVGRGQTSGSTTQDTRINQLQVNLALYQQIYSSLLSNYESIRLARLKNTPNIVQIERAQPSSRPVQTGTITNISVGGVLGLLLSGSLVFLIEYLDTTIKTPEEVEQVLQLPIIGFIPETSTSKKGAYPSVIANPRSPMAESYRALRVNLEFANNSRTLKTILVTSPSPCEGKTTTAVNLALILAQAQKRVVLLDADLRRPMVHKLLGVSNRIGLTSLFREDQSLQKVARVWKMDNLAVITSGALPPNPSELLSSEKMRQILNQIKSQADIVIIDSPPSLVSDATSLATSVDGLLLVVQPGKTETKAAATLIEQLRRLEIHTVGVVFNRIPQSRSYYYKEYAPYASYSYKRADKEEGYFQEEYERELQYAAYSSHPDKSLQKQTWFRKPQPPGSS